MINKNIISIIIGLLLLGGLFLISRPEDSSSGVGKEVLSAGMLSAEELNFDFNSVSMAAGDVSHIFKIKNTGTEPVIIGKMYTSCMCTVATLIYGDKKFGPYGMAGHGFIPSIDQEVNPGEEASVEAVFDPAAHGPAGIGRIERTIILENNSGRPLELNFSAVVTP